MTRSRSPMRFERSSSVLACAEDLGGGGRPSRGCRRWLQQFVVPGSIIRKPIVVAAPKMSDALGPPPRTNPVKHPLETAQDSKSIILYCDLLQRMTMESHRSNVARPCSHTSGNTCYGCVVPCMSAVVNSTQPPPAARSTQYIPFSLSRGICSDIGPICFSFLGPTLKSLS